MGQRHCILPSSSIQAEASSWSAAPLVPIMPWIFRFHMVPVISVGCFLHLRWTFVIRPSQFRICASMLMEKILEFGGFGLLLSQEARSTTAYWEPFSRQRGCGDYKQIVLIGEERGSWGLPRSAEKLLFPLVAQLMLLSCLSIGCSQDICYCYMCTPPSPRRQALLMWG